MKNSMRFFAMLLVAALVISFSTGVAFAEKKSSPFKELVFKIFAFSKKTTEKEVNAVGRGVKKGADVVVEEVKDVGKLVTGDKTKAKDVLVKPVMGTTGMVGETAHDVINAPIEAGEEIK